MRLRGAVPLLVLVLLGLSAAPAAHAVAQRPQVEPADGQYVVVYRDSVAEPGRKTQELQQSAGFESRLRFSHAIKGFAARLSRLQVELLRLDRDVEAVVPDRRVHATALESLAPGEPVPPANVRRVGAATTTSVRGASTARVAVIDTGIDLDHPDLSAVSGRNCVNPSATADDDHGHGTHVAGSIGARNNGAGVTGVAPGTRLVALKALDATGSGLSSQIICAIDWVTATRTDSDPANDVRLVNMSLGGVGPAVAPCATTSDPEHRAICASVAAGVTYVVAAGNDGWNFDYASAPDTPAAFPEVLTVAAMSDSDGLPGSAGGAPSCRGGELDDRYASFSNYATTATGQQHTVAGPGVCVRSTARNGSYTVMSGTSMASPTVAGLVALCLGESGAPGPCAGLTPAQIVARMRSDASARAAAVPSFGFYGDPLRPLKGRFYGHLAFGGAAPAAGADTTAPTVASVAPAAGQTGVPASTGVSATFSEAMDAAATQGAFSLVRVSDNAPVSGTFTWSGAVMTFKPTAALTAGATYEARVKGAPATAPARDAAGNALGADRTWRFSVAAGAPAGTTAAPSSFGIVIGKLFGGTAASLATDNDAYLQVLAGGTSVAWYGTFSSVPRNLASLAATYAGRSAQPCALTLSAWNWRTATWTPMASGTMTSTESTTTGAASGALSDLVSGTAATGDVRVRMACTSSASGYATYSDLLRIAYG